MDHSKIMEILTKGNSICQAIVAVRGNMTIPTWSEVEDLAVPALCAQVEHTRWRMSTVVVNCVVMCLMLGVGCVPIHMANPSSDDITIYMGMDIAMAESIDDTTIANNTGNTDKHLEVSTEKQDR